MIFKYEHESNQSSKPMQHTTRTVNIKLKLFLLYLVVKQQELHRVVTNYDNVAKQNKDSTTITNNVLNLSLSRR